MEEVMTFLRLTGKFSIFIGKFLIIAVIAQAIMVRFVPQDWVLTLLGMQNSYSVLVSAIVGIPTYISSISAVPLLRGLMDLGMDKGAALAFIIAGPIMSVPSILAVMALFKRRALYIYVTLGFFGALIFGYTYRLL
ncbi:MAG: permease [Armatimonadota bacterium]